MPVLAKTRVDKQYRTTVLREVRRILEVSKGDPIEWIYEDGKIVVKISGR